MTSNLLFRYGAVCATVFVTTGSIAVGQRATVLTTVSSRPASAVLMNFEKMTRQGTIVIPGEVRYPERYSAARVDSMLGGLERIAQTSSSGPQTSIAVLAIMRAGSADKPPAGIFDREIRLYRSSNKVLVRDGILSYMPKQKDRQSALAFLKSVALQSEGQLDFEYAAYHAAESLSDMGSDGRAVLRELQNKKLIRDGRPAGFTHWFLSTNGSR